MLGPKFFILNSLLNKVHQHGALRDAHNLNQKVQVIQGIVNDWWLVGVTSDLVVALVEHD